MKENLNKRDDVSYLQTVGRALSILEMFGQENTLSLPVIANRLGVGKTIAYRLVHTLTAEGFFDAGSSYEIVLFGGTGASAGLLHGTETGCKAYCS